MEFLRTKWMMSDVGCQMSNVECRKIHLTGLYETELIRIRLIIA